MKHLLLSITTTGLLALHASAAVKPAAKAPAHANAAQNQLHNSFTKSDVNKDGFLDAEELAKHFRGASAKPIEDKPGAVETHQDHLFSKQYDSNKDGKISRAEFEKFEIAQTKASVRKNKNYTRTKRSGYRSSARHSGYGGRRYGQPGISPLLYQRMLMSFGRGGNYSRFGKPSYRGTTRHHGRR